MRSEVDPRRDIHQITCDRRERAFYDNGFFSGLYMFLSLCFRAFNGGTFCPAGGCYSRKRAGVCNKIWLLLGAVELLLFQGAGVVHAGPQLVLMGR